MEKYQLSQVKMAAALKLSSSGTVSAWLGRAGQRLGAAREREVDGLVEEYLSAEPAEGWEAQLEVVESTATHSHAELAELLTAHMDKYQLSQVKVATALKLPSSTVSAWLSHTAQRLGAAREREVDGIVEKYLSAEPAEGWAAQAQAAVREVAKLVEEEDESDVPRPKRQAVAKPVSYRQMASTQPLSRPSVVVPPGCSPPAVSASKFPLGRCMQSDDGSLWTAEAEGYGGKTQHFYWEYTGPGEEDRRQEEKGVPTGGEPLPDGSYAVSFLVSERHVGRGPTLKRQFRVRWQGWSSEDDTWEDESSILTNVLIENFERLRDGGFVASVLDQVRPSLHLKLGSRAQDAGVATSSAFGSALTAPSLHACCPHSSRCGGLESSIRMHAPASYGMSASQPPHGSRAQSRVARASRTMRACRRRWRRRFGSGLRPRGRAMASLAVPAAEVADWACRARRAGGERQHRLKHRLSSSLGMSRTSCSSRSRWPWRHGAERGRCSAAGMSGRPTTRCYRGAMWST